VPHPWDSGTTNEHFCNGAFGGRTTITELFGSLRDALAADGADCGDAEAVYEDSRPGDMRHSLADISNAWADFGHPPGVTLDEGLLLVVCA
jgi:UDP-N-acetylglucosamine 4-epimerase